MKPFSREPDSNGTSPDPTGTTDLNEEAIPGDRGIPSINRVRSMQSRVTSVLAISLMTVLGAGLLTWYYSRALTRPAAAQHAAQASAKLQFARLAFGAAGSSDAEIDLRDAEKVARDFAAGSGKHQVTWQGPAVTLPKNKVKLLLNLVALGVVALPRGGSVHVAIGGTPPSVSFVVRAKGDAAKLSDQVMSLLSGTNGVAIDAHLIQPYYARRVAAEAGMVVAIDTRDGEVELKGA